MKNKINKLQKSHLIITIIILIIIIMGYSIININKIDDKYYYQVIDNYNTSKYTIDELNQFSQDDIRLSDFNLYYEELIQSDITFLNINKTVVEFIGDWGLPNELANGYGHKDLTNQNVSFNGENILITPVNTIHISQKTQDFLQKDWFDVEHFSMNNQYIPIILGYDFKAYYEEFDEIDLIFMHKKYKGKIVGFLENNEELILDNYWGILDMNKQVIVPYIQNNLSDYYDSIYKCNGYIYIDDTDLFDESSKKIYELAQKYNLDFSVLRGY